MLSRAEKLFAKGDFVRESYAVTLERRIKVKIIEVLDDLEMLLHSPRFKDYVAKRLTQLASEVPKTEKEAGDFAQPEVIKQPTPLDEVDGTLEAENGGNLN